MNKFLHYIYISLCLFMMLSSVWNAVMVTCDRRLLFDYSRYKRASDFCWMTQPLQNANCKVIKAMSILPSNRKCDEHPSDAKPGEPATIYWGDRS